MNSDTILIVLGILFILGTQILLSQMIVKVSKQLVLISQMLVRRQTPHPQDETIPPDPHLL